MDGFWIVLTGCLVAAVSAIPGCFLLLRKSTMIGDAIAHAVLPGIVIAYFFTQQRDSVWLLPFAALFGLFTTLLIESLNQNAKMQLDAAIGIAFTALFSLGVVLITLYADQVELDQECVLYGEIAYVPLSLLYWGNVPLGPQSVWILGGLLLFELAWLFWGYRGLVITTFDPAYAASIGIQTGFWHYSLMALTSLSTVLSFESVGVILVVAFLIGPAASAYLLTHHLPTMISLALVFGLCSAVLGYFLAVWWNASIAGGMVSAIGIVFLSVMLYHFMANRAVHVPEKIT
ncbi:MAG TPA: iron ABC transporter [Microscillaceae bacterium]|jgi:manganese/zinc/iron transport system permease protein|nr:iron ABC transporter [Microscillaceae bacterium]